MNMYFIYIRLNRGIFMELNKHICTQLVEKARAFAQITLDDDYIVRDNKPDVVRVIYSKGDIYLEDVKVGNQVVWVTGKLRFSTLYLSDDENHRLESVLGEIPFQEKLVMEEVEDRDEISVDINIEDLSVGIINSRKLMVRAVLNMSIQSMEEEENNFSCEIMEGSGLQQRTKEISMLCLVEQKKDMVRMQKELLLPNARTNIGELIFYQADFRNEEVSLQEDRLTVQMDAQVWVLYRSESTGEYECFETTVPVSGEISCDNLRGDEIFWTKITPIETEIEPRSDYDGEARMLGLDLTMEVEAQIYREEEYEILEDAYSLEKELLMEREEIPFHQLLVKNVSKIRLMEQAHLEPNQERILQICGSCGTITIDRIQKRENGLQVEGVLNVHILYTTTDDSMPFSHAASQVSFDQFMEIKGITPDSAVWVDKKIEQLQVNLLDNMEYEIKAILQISVLAMTKEYLSNIISIKEEPMDMEMLEKQPGMIGCVRKEGEDLWDIAKRYHATTENIIEIGNKVLVVKQVH